MIYLVYLLLLVSSAAAIDISFSNTTYYSAVAILEDSPGKVVTETQLVYDENLVKNFTTKDYNLYRTDGNYFNVDKNGIIRLRSTLPSRRVYIFQVSLLYTVILNDNTTQSGFLSANLRVQAIGPVYFDNSAYNITVTTNLQPTEVVHDFSHHILFNRSAFRNVYFQFNYVNNYYFSMEESTGILYVQRPLYLTTFSIQIAIEYDVTLKNGTIVSDNESVNATIITIGCRDEEEVKAFWPETYPCSAFRVPCAELDNGYYFSDGFATRVCNSDGSWLPTDYSNCSVKAGVKSFGLLWMIVATSNGNYVLTQLDRMKNDIEGLFPTDSVSNISPITGYLSDVQYGFMIAFKMDVISSLLSDSDISDAQSRFNRAYRFSNFYLRGRGLRLFKPIDSQCVPSQTTYRAKYLKVCSRKGCNYNIAPISSNNSCDSVELRKKQDNEPTTAIAYNETEPSYLTLNASNYHQNISAFAPKGTYILTVGFNISGNSVANISNYHYDLSGYSNDFFMIDRKQGHLTVNADLTSNRYAYNFGVSFFYSVTYSNGTVGHNYTESDIAITALAGVGFNASSYYITVDANYTINQTVLTTMSNFLIYDENFNLDTLDFSISNKNFFIDSNTGAIKIQHHVAPLRIYHIWVFLSYNGMITTTNKHYRSSILAPVQIYMLGCLELQIGSVVWPASQLCTTAVHDCYDIDHGFNQNGVVTRYCSNTGEWQDPDFSQCYFKPEAKPFVHLYFTFYTLSKFHILANLQGIIRSGNSLLSPLGVNDLTPYYVKESVIRYGMVVALRGEATPNDATLTNINKTIAESTNFARLRLQTVGNGIIGFTTSNKCVYPTYPTNAQNVTKFFAVCQKGENVSCECDPLTPTVGICNSTSAPPTIAPTSGPTTAATSDPITALTSGPITVLTGGPITALNSGPTTTSAIVPRVGLDVSAFGVTNTSIGLQWSDDTPGITDFEVRYSAVIQYNTTTGESSYVDTKEITTTDTSYMFTLLTPSTDYTFTVISYTKDGDSSSSITISQTTMEGRRENPSFVELHFSSIQECSKWNKDSELINKVVDSVVFNILPYCNCNYTSEYIKVWYVKCQSNLVDDTSDVILIVQLMPTNLLEASYVMQAMSKWVTSSGVPGMVIDGEELRIDQNCKVQIEHPNGKDCTQILTTGAPMGVNTNNDDNNNSAGTVVGGVIAGLVIISVTIVVLVVVVILLRRRAKQQAEELEISSSSCNAETMSTQLSRDF